ncbi:MAG: glucose 1-dehydrogenase [Anaerolineae bacterium]|nr:glucose 1-dehydrogenase [Anaerolineae bacterium]
MTNLFDLTDRIAIVTGGGRGIGREIARTLAGAGAHIAIAEFNAQSGEEAAQEIAGMGRRSLSVQTDVQDHDSVEAMVAAVLKHFGKIDILVNNAGIALNVPSETCTVEEWNRILGVNLYGPIWCCTAVGRHMLERKSGAIVNIASMSGSIVNKPQPQAGYNISKAGVIMLTKSLAAEWATRGVRVNSVSPGYIGTELLNKGLKEYPDWGKVWFEMTPQGHLGKPSDVAHAVWYLASDAAAYATGTDLIIDGGYTLW